MTRPAYARRRTEMTRDEGRKRKIESAATDDLCKGCNDFLIAHGLEPGMSWGAKHAQRRAAMYALSDHQDARRVMLHKAQDMTHSESMAEMIERDKRRSEREKLAEVARKARIDGRIVERKTTAC